MRRIRASQIGEIHNADSINPPRKATGQFPAWPPRGLFYAAGCLFAIASHAQAASASFTSLVTFSNFDNGEIPLQLAVANGKIYGVTQEGGAENEGTLFEYNIKRNAVTAVVQFGEYEPNRGINPSSVNGFGNALFVATENGLVYEYNTSTKTGQTVYAFPGGSVGLASGQLLLVDGTLYGAALVGQQSSNLFSLDISTGTETTLYSMTGWIGGGGPNGQLVYRKGVLYGAVDVWKNYQTGGIFTYDLATGAEKVVYKFKEVQQGGQPSGIISCKGVFYGANNSGGANKQGALFSYDPATGIEKTLYSFGSTQDDGHAYFTAPICVGTALYGTALTGGADNLGIVYSFDMATGQETIVHSFAGPDGAYPGGPLILHKGIIYGTTEEGQASNGLGLTGTIFQVVP